jgi:hypothetical protein
VSSTDFRQHPAGAGTPASSEQTPRLSEAPSGMRIPHSRRLPRGGSYVTWRPPGRLSTQTQDWLYSVLVRISTRAFGADMEPYWRERRAGDYFGELRQFTLLLNGEEIIGWTGHHVRAFGNALGLYLDSTGVLPEYQRRGLVESAQTYAVIEELLRRPLRTVYLVVRTENPVVYRVLREAAGQENIYPPLTSTVPLRIQAIGIAVAEWLQQRDILDPRYLRLAGAYAGLDELYGEMPTCDDQALNEFFAEHLEPVDAFILLVEATLARAAKHWVRKWLRDHARVRAHRLQAG